MPRVRPDDFRVLHARAGDHRSAVWARWWRHRDGTVTHQHYSNAGKPITTIRRDRYCTLFEAKS